MGNIQLREFSKLEYGDPRGFLIELRKAEIQLAVSDTAYTISALRTNSLKSEREMREAAIFCIGMSKYIGNNIFFSPVEQQDYDFVATWLTDETQHFTPVQLKELVPHRLNKTTSSQKIIKGLAKYVDSEDLIVAIHLNRRIKFDPQLLIIPDNIALKSLWVFGSLTDDQSRWRLYGDFMKGPDECAFIDFEYPQI